MSGALTKFGWYKHNLPLFWLALDNKEKPNYLKDKPAVKQQHSPCSH